MKTLAIVVAVCVLATPARAFANDAADAATIQDYAAREAQAGDLEQFTGGWNIALTILVLIAAVWLVFKIANPIEKRVQRHEAERANARP